MTEFTWPVRVYYEDTDAGGVVFYANYLKFMERARTEWLRSLGFEQDELIEEGVIFAVRHVELDFKRPARFNDMLSVSAGIAELGRASLTFRQEVRDSDEKTLCAGHVKVACLDSRNFRPRSIPARLSAELTDVN